MAHLNYEFKVRVPELTSRENRLLELNPLFVGTDNQKDTYYNVSKGRLKLREGNIENALIYYERENSASARQSDVILYKHSPDEALKAILVKLHGIKVIVSKERKIYFIDNVKFHFDRVETLGTFIEVEAIDRDGKLGIEKLKAQADQYFSFLNLAQDNLIAESYSDLLLQKTH